MSGAPGSGRATVVGRLSDGEVRLSRLTYDVTSTWARNLVAAQWGRGRLILGRRLAVRHPRIVDGAVATAYLQSSPPSAAPSRLRLLERATQGAARCRTLDCMSHCALTTSVLFTDPDTDGRRAGQAHRDPATRRTAPRMPRRILSKRRGIELPLPPVPEPHYVCVVQVQITHACHRIGAG